MQDMFAPTQECIDIQTHLTTNHPNYVASNIGSIINIHDITNKTLTTIINHTQKLLNPETTPTLQYVFSIVSPKIPDLPPTEAYPIVTLESPERVDALQLLYDELDNLLA